MLLDSMKVVSFCHVLQGPAATQYLADMGADVIKIEPVAGERARRWLGADMGDISGLYICANRNKKLFSVDLKSPEGREVVLSLIENADVVVENYRNGVMDRLGLSYEDIKKRKPDIIYARGTGWGSAGPMVERASQDLIIQARVGLVSATGSDRANPRAVGSAVVDQHAGALLAMGIVSAYVKKLNTGKGTLVEGSLFASGIDLQTEPLTVYLSSKPGIDVLDRNDHLATWYHQAPYGIYEMKDGHVAVSTNPVAKMADALDSDELRELADAHPNRDRDRIAEVFAQVLKTRTIAELGAAFDAADIWWGKVQNFDELAEDPQAKALEVFREVTIKDFPATLVNHPIRYDGKVPELRVTGYDIGTHTRDILAANGYDEATIDDLIARGVVNGPARDEDEPVVALRSAN
ncbi:MAG: hypothetical protein ABS76_07570 [Pelagibacterium sp. SCN 64-44]|nr:MAG: hypothetical protein ABS76_07570 [Pelagibacterium sp. SCN 64-44]